MLRGLWRVMKIGLADPTSRVLFVGVFMYLAVGTGFYAIVEGWSVLDSLYFSVVALTTVGFGDFSPEKAVSKAFTIVYLLTGVSLLVAFGTTVLRLSGNLMMQRRGIPIEPGDEDAPD
jgi:voltage-gated potassium channel